MTTAGLLPRARPLVGGKREPEGSSPVSCGCWKLGASQRTGLFASVWSSRRWRGVVPARGRGGLTQPGRRLQGDPTSRHRAAPAWTAPRPRGLAPGACCRVAARGRWEAHFPGRVGSGLLCLGACPRGDSPLKDSLSSGPSCPPAKSEESGENGGVKTDGVQGESLFKAWQMRRKSATAAAERPVALRARRA